MSGISNDMSATSRDAATLAQQAGEALVNTQAPAQDETAEETADATVVELSSAVPSPAVNDVPEADVPPDADAAGALANDLASQISGAGSRASSVHSPISTDAALKLTQP
jgi:hypothetical protein